MFLSDFFCFLRLFYLFEKSFSFCRIFIFGNMSLTEVVLTRLVELFETYRGHDQTLSLIGYSCKTLSDVSIFSDLTKKKLQSLSSQISNARVILRLLDDVPMLGTTLSYGLGKHERNQMIRMLTVMDNLASHFYYLCEHVAWLGDLKVLNVNSNKFWLLSLLAWLISIISSILT